MIGDAKVYVGQYFWNVAGRKYFMYEMLRLFYKDQGMNSNILTKSSIFLIKIITWFDNVILKSYCMKDYIIISVYLPWK